MFDSKTQFSIKLETLVHQLRSVDPELLAFYDNNAIATIFEIVDAYQVSRDTDRDVKIPMNENTMRAMHCIELFDIPLDEGHLIVVSGRKVSRGIQALMMGAIRDFANSGANDYGTLQAVLQNLMDQESTPSEDEF